MAYSSDPNEMAKQLWREVYRINNGKPVPVASPYGITMQEYPQWLVDENTPKPVAAKAAPAAPAPAVMAPAAEQQAAVVNQETKQTQEQALKKKSLLNIEARKNVQQRANRGLGGAQTLVKTLLGG